MTNQYMKGCSTSLVKLGKFTPQSQARYHYTLTRTAKIKKTDDAK